MKSLRYRRLRAALRSSEEGSVAVLFGLASIVLVGVVALAVDFTGANAKRAKLQSAADTAAVAGATVLVKEGTSQEATEFAEEYLLSAANGFAFSQAIDASVEAERVSVSLSSAHPSIVGSLFNGPMTVGVESIARLGPPSGNPVCIHALHSSMSKAVNSTGGTSIEAECDVFVNSSSSSSVTMTGGGTITANKACLHGGLCSGTVTPAPEDCGVREDPFASMSPSTSAACTHTNYSQSSGTYSLNPGVYCGGLTLTGGPTVALNPGTYVIRDGQLKMSGGGSMTGIGVTFVFEGSASVDLSGGGTYHLVAPTSGDFKSFVFFQRPSASPNEIAKMNGGGSTFFEGVIYLPTWETVITGGGSVATPSPFSAYIAKNFRAVGGSTISVVYDPERITVPVPSRLFLEPRTIYLSN